MAGISHVLQHDGSRAHNDLPAACKPWTDTLPLGVKVPGIQLPQKLILLQPGDLPSREPYNEKTIWLTGSVPIWLGCNTASTRRTFSGTTSIKVTVRGLTLTSELASNK
uniref:Uncharacterized protein n=1 Tax=Timema tahoe TaxID=61484 RepID=A0A7R9ISD4_9NEOP|nr:unnamed protein product [Timema tahoe]